MQERASITLMMTKMDVALKALDEALKLSNIARERAQTSKDSDLKDRISKLYDATLTLKTAVMLLIDENGELRKQLSQQLRSKSTPNLRCLGATTSYLREGHEGGRFYDDIERRFSESIPGAFVCFRNEADEGKDVAPAFDVRASLLFLDGSGQEMGTGIADACWLGDLRPIDFRVEDNHCVVVLLLLSNGAVVCPYRQQVTTSWGGGLRIDTYKLDVVPKTIEVRLVAENDLLLPPCAFDVSMVDGRPIVKQRLIKEISKS